LHGKSLFLLFVYPLSPLVNLVIFCAAAWLVYAASLQRGHDTKRTAKPVKDHGGFVETALPSFGRDGSTSRPSNPPVLASAWNKGFDLLSALNTDRLWRILVSLIVLVVVLLPRGLGFGSVLDPWQLSPFAWKFHFQAVAYPLTQVLAGKPLLAASPPLYGYYPEFLSPVFNLIGFSIFKFCLVMAVIQAVATVILAWIAIRFIRNRALRFLCCAALLYFTGGHCMVGRHSFDPYFQYWPVRFIFPAISIPAYLWAARRGRTGSWFALGCFAGCALMWNLESGIAVTGAVVVTLAVEAIGRFLNSCSSKNLFRSLAIVLISTIATAVLFWCWMHHQAGWKPSFHETSEYQRLFYQYGLFMTPMPMAFHPWWMIVGTYLMGLCISIRAFWTGQRSPGVRLILFLSVLGTGLFTYYQGRSNDFNLLSVSWPALLLGFLYADRLLRAIQARLLPSGFRWFALPPVYLGVMAVVMFPGMITQLWSLGSSQWRVALTPSATAAGNAMERRINFIRTCVGIDRECVILADLQAVYFAETGFRSSMDAPGLTELFFMGDLEMLRSSLERALPRHLFVDPQTIERLQLAETINARYRRISTSSDGRLIYLEPLVR
ncbi:MAG: hypothetical protein WCH43_03550, partial [Verrucomicrobiota bacterium]